MAQKRKDYRTLVKEHYKKEAVTHGLAPTSTMSDVTTRHAEVATIISYLKPGQKVLEVGCGNGAASVQIACSKKLFLTCIDFSEDLIALAKKQHVKDVRGALQFRHQDILQLDERALYDVIFTERCIINLMEWEHQQEALERMVRALKPGGKLLLLEAYKDGLAELNRARGEVGLAPVPPAYHNLHLEKEKVAEFLQTKKVRLVEENNFLSSYYFGSRVLYPALAQFAKKEVAYNSAFGSFFAALPPAGNFSHIKLLVFERS